MKRLLLALGLVLWLPSAAFAACTTGQTTCNTDTINDSQIVTAIHDPTVKLRVFALWLEFCFNNVWNEAPTVAGNLVRINFCDNVVSGAIAQETLVSMIMNSVVQGEVLSTTCPAFTTGANGPQGTAAGCMVDVDVNNSIATLMQVVATTQTTTATAVTGSTLLTVASATGISPGMNVYGAGIPAGAIVPSGGVSGTSVAVSAPTTAALSATPVLFAIALGLPR